MMKYLLFFLAFFLNISFARSQYLVSSEWLGQVSEQELQSRYGPIFQADVDLYKISYRTVNWDSTPEIASGLLVLPNSESVTLPLVIYMHGTIGNHDSIPSNLPYEAQIPIVYGGAGSISLAPDYLGFGDSKGFHPYHHADSESSNGIDMILAVREFLKTEPLKDNGQLFISGYSQGGHAAAALHRRLEEEPLPDTHIAGSAFMSGAYSLSGIMLQKILSDDDYPYPAFVLNLLLSYNMVYGWYEDLSQLFVDPYDELAMDFFSGGVNLGFVNEILRSQLVKDFGAVRPKLMLRDSLLHQIVNDSKHPVIKALEANDVFDWVPQSPVMIIYCRKDEQVPFRNAIVTDSVMRANGARNVQLYEADENADHFGCAEPAVFASLFFFNNQLTHSGEPGRLTSSPRIFPNPATGQITVEGFSQESDMILIDMKGRLVMKESGLKDPYYFQLDLPEGIYVAIIRSNKSVWRGKLVITR
jgi:predicted esterase